MRSTSGDTSTGHTFPAGAAGAFGAGAATADGLRLSEAAIAAGASGIVSTGAPDAGGAVAAGFGAGHS
jgi:hypothetical protein